MLNTTGKMSEEAILKEIEDLKKRVARNELEISLLLRRQDGQITSNLDRDTAKLSQSEEKHTS